MAAQGHDHVDLGPDPFDQPSDLVQIRWHVKGAIHRPKDIDPWCRTFFARLFGRHAPLGHAELGKDPGHRAVGAFPLILIDGARQKTLDIGTHRRHAAADHLGNRPRDNNARQGRVQHTPSALHRAFGSIAAKLFLAQSRGHDGQFMRRQTIGVMQHAGHRQVFTTHRPIDDDLQSLHRGKGIDRTPITTRAIMILDQHDTAPVFFVSKISWGVWGAAPTSGSARRAETI